MVEKNSPKRSAAAKKTTKPAQTKAQAAFQEHKAQFEASSTKPRGAAGTIAGPAWAPAAFLQAAGPGPGWAYPQHSAMMPQTPGATVNSPATAGSGSLSERLASTLRLGVDLINLSLAGSLRVLDGVSGMTTGYHGAYSSCYGCDCHGQRCDPCHSAHCCDPCSSECGCHDCCFESRECCQPSVGSCC